MGHFVKCFTEVHYYGVTLLPVLYCLHNVCSELDELCFAGKFISKAMLFTIELGGAIEVFHVVAGYDVFKLFTQDAGQGHWSVVYCLILLTFFIDWGDVCFFPNLW